MKPFFGLIFIVTFFFPTFAQNSNSYLKVKEIAVSGRDSNKQFFLHMEEIGGDKQPVRDNNRDSTTTKQIPPNESQLEDRQNNFISYPSVSNNQYISVLFENLSGKEIKKVSLKFILKENGKNIYERKFTKEVRSIPNGKIYVSESFFSNKGIGNISKTAEKEIIIESISFADGTKVKF